LLEDETNVEAEKVVVINIALTNELWCSIGFVLFENGKYETLFIEKTTSNDEYAYSGEAYECLGTANIDGIYDFDNDGEYEVMINFCGIGSKPILVLDRQSENWSIVLESIWSAC